MRVRKTVESPASFRTTEYFYTGSQLTAERDSDGTLYRYLYGPGGAPLEVRVTTGTVTASYAVHTDALGSVVALSDESGAPVATYAYDPWGAPIATTVLTASALDRAVALRQPFRYRGYTLDAETGLYYLPARYYDPQACRFLSPDPAAPSAGNPASLNPYVYCEDDPIGASDPSGAIADWDGNGKIDAHDSTMNVATHLKRGKRRDEWVARAGRQYQQWDRQRKFAAAQRALSLMVTAYTKGIRIPGTDVYAFPSGPREPGDPHYHFGKGKDADAANDPQSPGKLNRNTGEWEPDHGESDRGGKPLTPRELQRARDHLGVPAPMVEVDHSSSQTIDGLATVVLVLDLIRQGIELAPSLAF